jgi:hypothetical protein
MVRSAASMELVEITRIAINETDQAKIRGAVDIKVPFVVCPEAIVESQLAPARLIGEAASPVRPSTIVPKLEA